VDSVTNSFTARLANVPTHKSVGKNGTFWLPPESANSFSSKLKDLSRKNSRSPSKNPLNNPAPPNLQAKQEGGNAQSNLTLSRSQNSPATARNTHILQSTQSHSNSKNLKTGARVQTQSNLLPRAIHADNSVISKNQVTRGVEKKSSESENLLSKDKENQLLVGDKEEHEGQKNTKNHGAKDALTSDLMYMTERLNLIFTQAASIAKSENRLEEKSLKLLEDLSREIATKIALLEKDESKIVRMAFDLPNGSALSVRIEQTPSNLSISFITQDSETQDVIQFIQELVGRDQSNSNSSTISVFLFQSYQDMDSYFKQAA
jgi:hypothetical protein